MQIKKILLILSLCFAPLMRCNQVLFEAAYVNDLEKVKKILDSNDPLVDINYQNPNDETPLIRACKNNNFGIATLLLQNNANPNLKNNFSDTPLICACQKNYSELATLLIDKGADINAQNNFGNTPLICACQKNNSELATLLIDKGADINAQNKFGNTPLIYACQENYSELATLLIDKGADINAQNNFGYTPLIYVCQKNYIKVAVLLILAGADETNVRDPIYIAMLNQPMVTFARNLRQWILANQEGRQTIPDHQQIEEAFKSVEITLTKDEELWLASFMNANEWHPILAIELGLQLQPTRINFAIKHFDEIYEKYQTLMVNKF